MSNRELVVVGAGPAGLAASIEAARYGVDVTLIDENGSLGGQYLCQPETSAFGHSGLLERRRRIRRRLLEEFPSQKIAVFQNTTVCGIEDRTMTTITANSKLHRHTYERLILAAGAYDLPMPFPGWTLPGIISAGAALSLLRRQGVLPGRSIVIAGRGPLLVALAAELIAAGGNVTHILEASPGACWWKMLCASRIKLELALEGIGYWARILWSGISYQHSHLVTRALGEARIEEVLVHEVDEEWRPISGTEERVALDTLCVGFGFVPSTQLLRLAGCRGEWRSDYRAWVPRTDEYMRTSLEVVFAVGDGAVPEGVDIAEMEGRIAGLTAAWQLGRLAQSEWEHQVATYQAKLAGLRQFRNTVDSLFRLGKETDSLLSEDTLICRCEEVTLAEVMAAIREGATDLNTLKGWTRAGMGRCQGRNCEPSLAYLLHKKLNKEWQSICGFTPRFPVKPIPFAAMVKEEGN